jgi:excinuclease ABC subunit B
MTGAIEEVNRRRKIQLRYNRKNRIIPSGITKPIRARLVEKRNDKDEKEDISRYVNPDDLASLTPMDKRKLISGLKRKMMNASHDLLFEEAARIRDIISGIQEDI